MGRPPTPDPKRLRRSLDVTPRGPKGRNAQPTIGQLQNSRCDAAHGPREGFPLQTWTSGCEARKPADDGRHARTTSRRPPVSPAPPCEDRRMRWPRSRTACRAGHHAPAVLNLAPDHTDVDCQCRSTARGALASGHGGGGEGDPPSAEYGEDSGQNHLNHHPVHPHQRRSSRFPSREAKPAARRPPRIHRTGRTMQFNARTTPQTVEALYAIADQQSWLVGETLEHALAALQRELAG
jgi:hypothetical protein